MARTTYNEAGVLWNSHLMQYDGIDSTPPSTTTPTSAHQDLKRVTDTRPNTLIPEMLDLFKQHARITHSLDDTIIRLYLRSAISRWEQYTQIPVAPAAYEWDLPQYYNCHAELALPLQNCAVGGRQFGFDLLPSKKYIFAPTAWPVKLEVGYTALAEAPDDVILGIFEIALFLYEQRSTPEMANGMLNDIIGPIIQRYWTPRC